MCTRNVIDEQKNKKAHDIAKAYPELLTKYIISLSRKTSYTKAAYVRYVKSFLDYICKTKNIFITDGHELSIIKPIDIDAYMEFIRFYDTGIEKSAMYRAAQLAAINSLFFFLKRNDIIPFNPCDTVEVPKDNKEHEIITMSKNDINIMINNIRNGCYYKSDKLKKKWMKRDELIVILGISTGLRVSAIVGIDVSDINLEKKYIRVIEKGKVEKNIYIGDRTLLAIKEWLKDRSKIVKDDEDALFIRNGGKRMTAQTVENIIRVISDGKFTPHKMRATCATRLYDATGDIYLVQQQLGHKNIRNTERYAKVSEEKKKQSAQILDSLV